MMVQSVVRMDRIGRIGRCAAVGIMPRVRLGMHVQGVGRVVRVWYVYGRIRLARGGRVTRAGRCSRGRLLVRSHP